MAQNDHRKATMTLYTEPDDPKTHWIRIVLAEKNVQANIVVVNKKKPPAALTRISPYEVFPVFVDRDLVLHEAFIVAEYLDDRFPHPQLIPVYPVVKAKCRQIIYQIDKNWYTLLRAIQNEETREVAQKKLQNSLMSLAPWFGKPYFLEEEFTLVDCCIAPLLWRLFQLKIEIINKVPAILAYQTRVFERLSFQTTINE